MATGRNRTADLRARDRGLPSGPCRKQEIRGDVPGVSQPEDPGDADRRPGCDGGRWRLPPSGCNVRHTSRSRRVCPARGLPRGAVIFRSLWRANRGRTRCVERRYADVPLERNPSRGREVQDVRRLGHRSGYGRLNRWVADDDVVADDVLTSRSRDIDAVRVPTAVFSSMTLPVAPPWSPMPKLFDGSE